MKILVIGAHADDPEVSMGGTIAKFIAEGHEVCLLVCIIPCESRDGRKINKAKKTRWEYQESSAAVLGASVHVLDMDPYTFGFNRTLVKAIDDQIVDYKPDTIFTQWDHDSHQDHKAVAHATFAAARKNNISVLMYEQLTLGGITPDSFRSHVYIDITETIEKKIASVKCYQFLKEQDIEAIYSLARFRGNQIGVKYAECFEVCKIIGSIGNTGMLISSVLGNKQ
tara:strand:+ start:11655 stop:12329 length:675 start_codon:yes stop_codon:yes gene_type:complete